MTLRIVYDPQGREVVRGGFLTDDVALARAWECQSRDVLDLMRLAGYAVKEAPRMVEVPLDDLREATRVTYDEEASVQAARIRLLTIVDRERGR